MTRAQRRREARAKRKREKRRGQHIVWCPCGKGFEKIAACIEHQDKTGHVTEA